MKKEILQKKLDETTADLKKIEIAYNQLTGRKILLEELIKEEDNEK